MACRDGARSSTLSWNNLNAGVPNREAYPQPHPRLIKNIKNGLSTLLPRKEQEREVWRRDPRASQLKVGNDVYAGYLKCHNDWVEDI